MNPQDPEDVVWTRLLAPEHDETKVIAPEPTPPAVGKRRCLVGLLAISFLAGVLDPFVSETTPAGRATRLVVSLIGTGFVLIWCLLDARRRGYRIGLPLRVLIIAVALIGVPYYLLRTRGLRGLVSIGLAVLFMAACAALAGLTAMALTYLQASSGTQ